MPVLLEVLSAEEVVRAVEAYREAAGTERFGIKEFTRETGIPESQIYRHFGSWSAVRRAAGLTARLRAPRWYSDDELFAELHKVCMKLHRIPTWHEFSRLAPVGWQVLHRRMGGKLAVLEGYKTWVHAKVGELREGREERARNPQRPRLEPERDVAWVRDKWLGMRVGFELRSRDFKGRRPDDCDLLVVLEHDWKGCPVRVLELKDVLMPGEM